MGEHMELALINPQTLRFRGKQVVMAVNPTELKTRMQVDAVAFFSRMPDDFPLPFLEGIKLIIEGPGEYEVSGVKISGISQLGRNYYDLFIDNIDLLIGDATTLAKAKDLKEYSIVAIYADIVVDQAIIAELNPKVVLLYGEKAAETMKMLGKEDISPLSKFVTSKERLPQDTQIILLS